MFCGDVDAGSQALPMCDRGRRPRQRAPNGFASTTPGEASSAFGLSRSRLISRSAPLTRNGSPNPIGADRELPPLQPRILVLTAAVGRRSVHVKRPHGRKNCQPTIDKNSLRPTLCALATSLLFNRSKSRLQRI